MKNDGEKTTRLLSSPFWGFLFFSNFSGFFFAVGRLLGCTLCSIYFFWLKISNVSQKMKFVCLILTVGNEVLYTKLWANYSDPTAGWSPQRVVSGNSPPKKMPLIQV